MSIQKWYAKVRYYNGDVEDISVRKIKTQEVNQFSPKNYKDFNSNILYSVKTAMNDVEGKEQRYYAYIGKLAGSIEGLNDYDKRISWPTWSSDALDEPDNTSQDERQQNTASSSILAHREKAKHAEHDDMHEIMSSEEHAEHDNMHEIISSENDACIHNPKKFVNSLLVDKESELRNSSKSDGFEEIQLEVLENNSQISPYANTSEPFSYQQSSRIIVNEEENFWKERQNEKRTICPCTKSTAEDVMLMCLTLGLRHNLSWLAQVDILKMINAMYGDEKIPNTKYKYFNHIDRSGDNFKYHIFCPECEKYFGNRDNLLESIDCNCGHVISVYSSNYFLSIDLEFQFKRLLKNTTIIDSLLTYRFNHSKINDTALEDIYDGAEYRKHFDNGKILSHLYNFSYSFSTDGIPMGKSCGKTIWPIYVTINELPPKERSKHVLLAGLYVGKKDPNQNVFLQPFIEQANKLSLHGFHWNHNGKDVISKVIPLCAIVDSVARFQMLNMSGINAYYACTFCYQKAEHTVKGQRFPPCTYKVPERTTDSTIKDIEKTYEKRNERDERKRYVKGVKGPTALLQLHFFNLIAGFVPDYMHCILLGVIRLHTELLFDSTRKKFWKNMRNNDEIAMKHLISAIDEHFINICALTSITRSVRSLSQISIWKASEWRSWLIFYCIPCLKGFLKKKYLKHLAMLSKATNMLLQQSVTKENVVQAHELVLSYVFLFNKYFGVTSMVLNVHLLTHIAQNVLNWGPLWTHNAFVYEGQNRHVLQLLQSPGYVVKQIARKFLIFSDLPILCMS